MARCLAVPCMQATLIDKLEREKEALRAKNAQLEEGK